MFCFLLDALTQGSPTPSTGLWPVRNQAAQQAGKRAKLHLYLQPLPIAHITAWALPPVRSLAALNSHRSTNTTVNCACKWFRLRAPYENRMPDDLRWSWGSDASTGEWLQIQIIISREVWLHRNHNKSIACRLISKPCQWVVVKTSSGLPLILHYGELYNYFIIYYNVIIIEIKCTIKVMYLNHPKTILPTGQWKNCLPRNQSLVPKRLGTATLTHCNAYCFIHFKH